MEFFRLEFVALSFSLLTLLCAPMASAQWYSGGSLTRASGAQWKAASNSNRLATAADFAAVVLGKQKVLALGSMDRLRPYAEEMKSCIDESVAGKVGDSLRVSEVGAICATMMGWT